MHRAIILSTTVLLILSMGAMAAPGDVHTSIPAPFVCPQGLTSDGTHLYCVDRRSDQIYQVDPESGSVLDSLVAPGWVPRGLTFDGTRIWCVDAEAELIFAVNPTTRIVERTIYCPVSRPNGLAWDGTYLWVCDDGDNILHQISPEDGTTISSVPAPSSHPCGLTFDGTYLWVSDRYKDMIYMITPDRGEVIVCLESPGAHPWGLAWHDGHLWNVDYQEDLIYQLSCHDDTYYTRTEEKTQRVEFIHQVRNFGPDSVKSLDVYMAIPQDLPNQELLSEVRFDPRPVKIVADKWGQKVAHFEFPGLASGEATEISMFADVRLFRNRYFVLPEEVGGLQDIPEDIRRMYLVDDTKFSLNSDVIVSAVDKAVGEETNPYWIGRKIFDYVIENMEYELAGGWNIAPAVLDRGNGSCSEYSFVYIAMCRAAGLPARYVGSIVIRGDDASYDDVFHRWVEIYLPGYGWLPVDPSGGDHFWPADQANAFGYLNHRFLITTIGGGGSEYLDWGYNANERWTSTGRTKVAVENFGEWTPLIPEH